MRRKNIVLFVAMIENQFSHAICEGALMGAKEIDANLFILPAGIIDAKYDDVDANCYRYQYNSLYSCVDEDSIDAIIIEYGTVTSFLDAKKKKKFLESLGNIPVVLLAGQQEGYSSICVDNRAGLREAIEHLLNVHHCEKVGFVSGPTTSQDAIERLEVFKNTMAEHGKHEMDDWIVYGNFSEFSEEVVEDLLTRHPDIEAIVCANDQMAVGAYNVLKKMNKVPGKDILITGFDDSPTAMILDPNLASVKADTKELAYLAVLECLNAMKGEVIHKYVKSRLILRESCGCDTTAMAKFTQEGDDIKGNATFAKELAEQVFENYFNNYFDSEETLHMKQLVVDYFDYFLHRVDEKGGLNLEHSEFVQQYMRFSETYRAGYISLNLFLSVNYLLYGYVSKWIESEENRLRLMEEMSLSDQEFMNTVTKQRMISGQKANVFEIVLTNITRDMLQFSASEKKRYNSVLTKFQKMDFASGYLLGYGEGLLHLPEDNWKQPENLYIKGYYNNSEDVYLYQGKDCPVPSKGLFCSDIMPSDRRFDMLVMPLFSGQRLYGLMLTESAFEYFQYATQIACQVSVSVEVIEILKKQNALKAELEKNLVKMEESNRVLDQMSRSDTLTGISNRRGFLDKVERIIGDYGNYGQRAVAVYADMDCLKIVNDEFGHDEGDFALKTIATALSESFRQSDVVARMGGDEFAAFAIINHDNFSETLKDRIQEILSKLNDNDKPYYVNMSIGIHEFVIDADTNLNHVLSAADENLYMEKKNKVKVVYKNNLR